MWLWHVENARMLQLCIVGNSRLAKVRQPCSVKRRSSWQGHAIVVNTFPGPLEGADLPHDLEDTHFLASSLKSSGLET